MKTLTRRSAPQTVLAGLPVGWAGMIALTGKHQRRFNTCDNKQKYAER